MSKEAKRINREELPIFEHKRYRCEQCRSPKFKTVRSKRDTDGVSTQERKCCSCGFRFYLIVQ